MSTPSTAKEWGAELLYTMQTIDNIKLGTPATGAAVKLMIQHCERRRKEAAQQDRNNVVATLNRYIEHLEELP